MNDVRSEGKGVAQTPNVNKVRGIAWILHYISVPNADTGSTVLQVLRTLFMDGSLDRDDGMLQ